MAKLELRRSENVTGDFYVDSTCIDCDTCRWMAPETFERRGDSSAVTRQPTDAAAVTLALEALVACPTASIGTVEKHAVGDVARSFPKPVTRNVFHCGYHDESSFGAASYLVRRPEGNVLIDSPRFAGPLVRRLEELGGVSILFLTHRDDVGRHDRFHDHFGCERVIHRADAVRGLASAERVLEGTAPVALADDLLVLPVPGHTRGSCVLLHREFLFSGDHVAWSDRLGHVHAFRDACWYDWATQIESMRRLAEYDFEWILPGHGRRCHLEPGRMREEMARAVAWMEGREFSS